MPDHDIALGQQLLRVHDRLRARVAALDALVRDHEFLDPLLDRLEQLAAVPPADRSVTAVQRALVSVLDRMDVAPGSADAEALRAPLRGILEPEHP